MRVFMFIRFGTFPDLVPSKNFSLQETSWFSHPEIQASWEHKSTLIEGTIQMYQANHKKHVFSYAKPESMAIPGTQIGATYHI